MADPSLPAGGELSRQIEQELVGDILPFWMRYMVDHENGGFYGSLTHDLVVDNEVPRSAVLCGRILWTYATAARHYGHPEYLQMAEHAYRALKEAFWDQKFGGVYWSVDKHGQAVMDRKHCYAQAFAIYGLSQYYQVTHNPEHLDLAKQLFAYLEKYAYDPVNLGYIESCGRDWLGMADMRLSDKEPVCRKSMNTLLHIMEAYTNLLRVWDDPVLRQRLGELIGLFLDHVIDSQTCHFRLFFDDQWHSMEEIVSYGHDIEGSWLLLEAAEVLGDEALIKRVTPVTLAMVQAVYDDGLARDGGVIDEYRPDKPGRAEKSWWGQAEGMVGFYNAFQMSGQEHFSRVAFRLWNVIDTQFIDHQNGDWYKLVDLQGKPILSAYKAGPWECPYHHARACFEMVERMGK